MLIWNKFTLQELIPVHYVNNPIWELRVSRLCSSRMSPSCRQMVSCRFALFPWRKVSSGMLRRVALVRTDVSLRRNTKYFFAAYVGCYLQLVLFLVHRFLSPSWRRCQVPPKRRFLQESHGVTSQKTPFFIVTAVKTSNSTYFRGGWCLHIKDTPLPASCHLMMEVLLWSEKYARTKP
jgi:hypothetical protein